MERFLLIGGTGHLGYAIVNEINNLREKRLFISDIIKNAEGSCNIKCGNTEIICTATIDENVPHFIRKTGLGWVTAEYGMLPRSTNSRMKRESSRGKQGGRTLEIQRLIGRSLRTCVDPVSYTHLTLPTNREV